MLVSMASIRKVTSTYAAVDYWSTRFIKAFAPRLAQLMHQPLEKASVIAEIGIYSDTSGDGYDTILRHRR